MSTTREESGRRMIAKDFPRDPEQGSAYKAIQQAEDAEQISKIKQYEQAKKDYQTDHSTIRFWILLAMVVSFMAALIVQAFVEAGSFDGVAAGSTKPYNELAVRSQEIR